MHTDIYCDTFYFANLASCSDDAISVWHQMRCSWRWNFVGNFYDKIIFAHFRFLASALYGLLSTPQIKMKVKMLVELGAV